MYNWWGVPLKQSLVCVFQATMFWFPVKSVHNEFGGLSWMTGTPFPFSKAVSRYGREGAEVDTSHMKQQQSENMFLWLGWNEPSTLEWEMVRLTSYSFGGAWSPLLFTTAPTLVCSFLSCLMSARFSLSFALSSRSFPTTWDVWAIQDLIALSRLRWASISCGAHEVVIGEKLPQCGMEKWGGNTQILCVLFMTVTLTDS